MAASPAAGFNWVSAAQVGCRTWLRRLPARFWPAAVITAGALLRVAPWLFRDPLHRDEALYGAWARLLLSGRDPALLSVYVDKPPLVLYLLAGSMGAFGASEFALRLPGLLASIALLFVTYGLARRLGSRRPALLATAIVAASPYGILFAPTAFTDPWLALWLAAAAWAALARRPFGAGLLLGLAIASKQTGILGLPLVGGLMIVCHLAARDRASQCGPAPTSCSRGPARHVARAVRAATRPTALASAGLVLVCLPVIYWDSLRWATRGSFWTRSLDTYGGLHLAAAAEWPLRLRMWGEPFGYLFGRPVLTLAMFALAGTAAWHGLVTLWGEKNPPRAAVEGAGAPRTALLADLVIAGYVIAYLLVHVGFTFQPWDRYLLPLVPLLALLSARGAQVLWRRMAGPGRGRAAMRTAAAGGMSLLLVATAWSGMTGRVPVGSDHYAYLGLEQMAAAVHRLPWTAVVYEHSLGWQLDFYMFDSPPPHIWWDRGTTLADDAEYGIHVFPDREQLLVLATAVDGPAEAEARQALAGRGLRLVERQRIVRPDGTTSFVLYQIEPEGASEPPHGPTSAAGDVHG